MQKIQDDKNNIIIYGNADVRDVTLSFRVPGRIETMNFLEGDQVKTGTELAKLDKEPYENDLQIAKAQLAEAEILFTQTNQEYNRHAKLVKTGAISQNIFENSTSRKKQSAAKVKAAKAQVSLGQIKLQDTSIIAPSNGTIITRVVEKGAVVNIGTPIYVLSLDDEIWVRAYIDERRLGNIFPGQEAIITTDSGGSYVGQIGFISPQAEFTPKNVETTDLRTDLVYRLRIVVKKIDSGLRQGMPVTVTIKKYFPK
jgi:HlyD family secretion protein